MKLKTLIVSGFKSFADKTEFEFDDGVSCVVGPNGCGKSNVVDAVKWVLGEQSAKSLRGKEMMDVLFNGSSARKAAGMARVTLVFDNADGLLTPMVQGEPQPSEVVSVTRRLFRNGQSEYLINKQTCRLRDIREMFMDTGVGIDAYSVIEQGQVARFLQAGQDERRAIFDEVAGISKYKARKRETLRKLDRVEQNMLRLQDVLGEVEKRLRSIKLQAGKARNYQIYAERLKELRSLYFLAQYHELTLKRARLQKDVDTRSDRLGLVTGQIAQLETTCSGTEAEVVELTRTARDLQAQVAGLEGRIETSGQRAEMLRDQAEQLAEQILSATSRCEQLQAKTADLAEQMAARQQQMAAIEAESADLSAEHDSARAEHTAGQQAVTHLQASLEDEKAGTVDLLRRTSQLHSEIKSHHVRRESLASQRTRLATRAEEIRQRLEALVADRAEVEAKRADVQAVLAEAEAKLTETRQAARALTENEQQLHAKLSEAREQRSAAQGRIEALREMQERLEGVAAGVRSVLQRRSEGALPSILGMAGDFVQTDVAHAAAVEAALAGADQQLLARDFASLQADRAALTELLGEQGTAEVLCLDSLGLLQSDADPRRCPQVRARVIDWVRFEPWLAPVMWRLLGRTLAVDTLADARTAARALGEEYRFVTSAGEVLEAGGLIRLGAGRRGAGVIARRSELADLQQKLASLDQEIASLDEHRHAAREEIHHLGQVEQAVRTAIYEANTERVECQTRQDRLHDEIETLQREQPVVAQDLEAVAGEIEAAVRQEHEARHQVDELEKVRAEREAQIEKLTREIAAGQTRQEELAARLTELKVAMASADAKRVAARDALVEARSQHDQARQDLRTTEQQIEHQRQTREQAEKGARAAAAEVQTLTEQIAAASQEAVDAEESRAGLEEKLQAVRTDLAARRKSQDEIRAELNTVRVELGECDVRVESLVSRAADEMDMPLPDLFGEYEHDTERDWDAVKAEITELRGKMERLGNVNLDAITEQAELEERHEHYARQVRDIEESEKQLQDLIRRINRESRQRFEESFQAVRENFQELFRKLFGGGRADILLLEPEDVLESPIEIVARPPGKELRNLTLLSGGEKTMTALALLFGIFKCRPSPFCLLDEVDAALDEANTERFASIVQDFIARSQFIIISHAKRTMAMANVLYGVTMQEPGVSKRISVRFEDAGKKLDEQLAPVEA